MTSASTPDFGRDLHWILGIPFDAISLPRAADMVRQAAKHQKRLFFSTPNLNFLIASQTNLAFAGSVIRSDLSLADGMPIVWIARLLGIPITRRVAGSSLFESLRSTPPPPDHARLRVFFFGGPDGAAQAASEAINRTPVGMECVGFASPGFGNIEDMSSPEIIDHINSSNADFLVVALGASKGQAWIEHNLKNLQTPVISHLGAVVNFVAGRINRAPNWIQKLGLEWIWRIKEEPALWRRYWNDGLRLLQLICTQAIPLSRLMRKNKANTSAPWNCHTEFNNNRLRMRWQGPLVQANVASLCQQLSEAQIGGYQVELDLSACSFVDCAALSHIVSFSCQGIQSDAHLVIAGASETVKSIFKLANVPLQIQMEATPFLGGIKEFA